MTLATISKLILIILLLSLLYTISKSSSTPTYLYHICSNTTTFATNSKYHTNLNTLFRYLSSNATTNPTGFDITSVGNNTSDAVYGLFLCRGDQNITECSDCVSTATRTDLPKTYCPSMKVALIWYDECLVRYSNEPLRGKMAQSPEISLINTQNIDANHSVENQTLLLIHDILGNTMNNLAIQTATSQSSKKYATNVVVLQLVSQLLLGTLYAMEQCTTDLSASDCNQCLRIAIGKLHVRMGARVMQPSCFVRYETYPFYIDATNFSSPPSPLPSPRTNSTVTSGNGESTGGKEKQMSLTMFFVVVLTPLAVSMLLVCFISSIHRRKRKVKEASEAEIDEIKTVESLHYNLSTIRTATHNFCVGCKLGEGGFGEVYKGKLYDGQDIAVKRLSKNSGQGVAEFKTEVVLVAKLQHKNLVKLFGFCVESMEKILVYEFLPNSSLDRILFDPAKKVSLLDWQTRFKILLGVARGLLYLHEDSRLKIIHRDLKPSNILLDESMNPKISDFGLAKLFDVDQTQGDTKRIVGTYGYMAPEYAITGHYSVKSDVYSFGVIMLEVVSGQRSRYFGPQLEEALLHRAWRLWNEQKALDLVDPTLINKFPREEVTKCIHVGLLCVQGEAFERPRMTTIVGALTGQSTDITMPKLPHFFGIHNITDEKHQSLSTYSGTNMITDVYSRE